jgi:hypothetical protein
MTEGEQFCRACGRDAQAAAVPIADPSLALGIEPETSGSAIFSLISGLFVIFIPFSIVAIIFGHLSLHDIRKSPGKLKGRGLAITGIVLGYLGVGITVAMIGLAIYAVRTEKKSRAARVAASNENSAVSSIRSLNTAEIAYAAAHANVGYTCSLPDLRGVWGISAELAQGKKHGYVFELRSCKAAQTAGPITKYQLVAYPAGPAKGKSPAYCSDESDVIRMSPTGSADDCLRTGTDLTEKEITHPQN